MADINGIWEGWHAEELLGQGAYGKVYRISRSELGHTSYAAAKLIEIPQDGSEIKSLMDMGMDNLSIRSYFESTARNIINEIAVMESLKGARNVVAIEDYKLIEHEDSIGWTICIRMELLQSLSDYQKEVGPPTVDETIRLGIDICNALMCCEGLGVIHRDVKPENVFHSTFGEYKLGDFGVSRQIENSTKSVYSQKGTGPYMAPEVVRGEKYRNNVDVYSLGIMLYRYLNDMRFPFLPPAPQAFTAEDMEQALFRRLKGDPVPPPSQADEALAEIICKACEADASRRYQSASELHDDLAALQEGRYPAGRKVGRAVPQQEPARQVHVEVQPEPAKQAYVEVQPEPQRVAYGPPVENAVVFDAPETGAKPECFEQVPQEALPSVEKTKKTRKFVYPVVLAAIALAVIVALAGGMVARQVIKTDGEGESGWTSSSSEYIGEWYVPTDTDRRITISSNGSVAYGDDNHGTIASGKWTVIDEDAGAIKLTLKAEAGCEQMFEEGPEEFSRMAYSKSDDKLTAQLYYSPTEWETYVKQQ